MVLTSRALRSGLVPAAVFLLAAVASAGAAGCSSDDDADANAPPDNVSCASVARAKDGQGLIDAIQNSPGGGCVVISGTVASNLPIVVKEGVTVVGAKGRRASLVVTENIGPSAVFLSRRAQLGNLDVLASPGNGVAVTGTGAKIFDVKVASSKKAAVVVLGNGDEVALTLEKVVAEKNAYGVYAVGSGVKVTMKDGRIAENGGTSLSAGAGVIAAGGAHVELDGVAVESNEGTGVLLDGASTRALIRGATVSDNRQRGVWAQGLQGTLEAPALEIRDTEISKNRIVGVGGVELKGIIIVGGSVKETVASPVPTNLSKNELIGDGVGIFDGSTDFKIERTNFVSNERAAGVIDGTEVGIIIVGGKVEPGPGLKFVVQNNKADVQISDLDKSVLDAPLGVSAPKIQVPTVSF